MDMDLFWKKVAPIVSHTNPPPAQARARTPPQGPAPMQAAAVVAGHGGAKARPPPPRTAAKTPGPTAPWVPAHAAPPMLRARHGPIAPGPGTPRRRAAFRAAPPWFVSRPPRPTAHPENHCRSGYWPPRLRTQRPLRPPATRIARAAHSRRPRPPA